MRTAGWESSWGRRGPRDTERGYFCGHFRKHFREHFRGRVLWSTFTCPATQLLLHWKVWHHSVAFCCCKFFSVAGGLPSTLEMGATPLVLARKGSVVCAIRAIKRQLCAWFQKSHPGQNCRAKLFSVFLCQRCRDTWRDIRREILVKFSERHVFHAKTAWEMENFTQISLCWDVALTDVSYMVSDANGFNRIFTGLYLSVLSGYDMHPSKQSFQGIWAGFWQAWSDFTRI